MNWRDDVKVGDKLIYSTRGAKGTCTVERLTKTRIVTNRGAYNKSSGKRTGGENSPWDWNIIEKVATPEDIEKMKFEIKRQNLITKISRSKNARLWARLPLEELERIAALLDAAEREPE